MRLKTHYATVTTVVLMLWAGPSTAADRLKLKGARPVIEASRYATLQAAIDDLPDTGGVVLIPPGVFEISKPLKIQTPDTKIMGYGSATQIKNVNRYGEPAISIAQNPEQKRQRPETAYRLWRVELANFRVTGNETSGHGIEAYFIAELVVQGVSIDHHGGDGIHMHRCGENPRIADCQITYNRKTGLMMQGPHDIVVSANQFEENQDALRCLDGYNLCMTGNNLDDHLGHGVVIENTYGSVVTGNMIEESKGFAIILDRDCYGITLSANVIAHNYTGGIDLRDAHGCAVTGNTFTLVKGQALHISPHSGRITVTGNNFCDSYIGGGPKRTGANRRERELNEASGLFLDGTSDVAISGNLFSRVGPKAVVVMGEPSRRVLFANNVLSEVKSDHKQIKNGIVAPNLLEKQ